MRRVVMLTLIGALLVPVNRAFAGDLESKRSPLPMQVTVPPAFPMSPGMASQQIVIVIPQQPYPPRRVYYPRPTPSVPGWLKPIGAAYLVFVLLTAH